jgi:hypothetical protein
VLAATQVFSELLPSVSQPVLAPAKFSLGFTDLLHILTDFAAALGDFLSAGTTAYIF